MTVPERRRRARLGLRLRGSNAPEGARTCTGLFQCEYVTLVVPSGATVTSRRGNGLPRAEAQSVVTAFPALARDVPRTPITAWPPIFVGRTFVRRPSGWRLDMADAKVTSWATGPYAWLECGTRSHWSARRFASASLKPRNCRRVNLSPRRIRRPARDDHGEVAALRGLPVGEALDARRRARVAHDRQARLRPVLDAHVVHGVLGVSGLEDRIEPAARRCRGSACRSEREGCRGHEDGETRRHPGRLARGGEPAWARDAWRR